MAISLSTYRRIDCFWVMRFILWLSIYLIVRAEVSKPLKEEQSAEDFLTNLIDEIGMKILYGPVSRYYEKQSNRGLTAFSIIETSHVALDIWDEVDPALL